MSAVAVIDDFATLKQLARTVEKQRESPSLLETATVGLRVFHELALRWDRLDESHRDLLRHLVHILREDRKVSWLRRQRAAFEMLMLTSRHGLDKTTRLAADFLRARDEFASTVASFEERSNEKLQAALAGAVESALDRSSRIPMARDKVGEWLKRLPS